MRGKAAARACSPTNRSTWVWRRVVGRCRSGRRCRCCPIRWKRVRRRGTRCDLSVPQNTECGRVGDAGRKEGRGDAAAGHGDLALGGRWARRLHQRTVWAALRYPGRRVRAIRRSGRCGSRRPALEEQLERRWCISALAGIGLNGMHARGCGGREDGAPVRAGRRRRRRRDRRQARRDGADQPADGADHDHVRQQPAAAVQQIQADVAGGERATLANPRTCGRRRRRSI